MGVLYDVPAAVGGCRWGGIVCAPSQDEIGVLHLKHDKKDLIRYLKGKTQTKPTTIQIKKEPKIEINTFKPTVEQKTYDKIEKEANELIVANSTKYGPLESRSELDFALGK